MPPELFINMAENMVIGSRGDVVEREKQKDFSSMLLFGATIPTRLRCYSGLASCPTSCVPPALHPGRTCRVNNTG
jgi:hypothetical protein